MSITAIKVLALIVLYFCKESRRKLVVGYGAYCLGYLAIVVTDLFPRIYSRINYYTSFRYNNTWIAWMQSFTGCIGGINSIFYSASWQDAFFTLHYQWMMIFALPIMLFYNGKRGKGLKWFFYLFYPLHIVVLYCIGRYCEMIF